MTNKFAAGTAMRAIVLTLVLAAQPFGTGQAAQTDRTPPPCAPVSGPPAPVTATTVGTIEQAYHCIVDHYYDGSTRDHRALLTAFQVPPSTVTGTVLPGDIAYVALPGFSGGSADRVRQTIAGLGADRTLRGLVLDLRGNRGGSVSEVNRLLGAFIHGEITGYHCAADGTCAGNHTDDTVPLLNLPLVALTDRNCASACDHFSSAVKDLHLGPLVGARTAGLVSGPSNGYVLSDNSTLGLASMRHLGPDREVIDGIGVAPDHYLPRTAHDLSTGRDPALDKALDLLTH